MQVQELVREFKYNSVKLNDPNPAFTLTQVRDFFANVYPEIINAEIEGPEVIGNRNVYSFRRAVGTKGGAGLLHTAFAAWAFQHGVALPPPRHEESTRMIKDLAALEKRGYLSAPASTARMIHASADFVAEHPEFPLSPNHVKRIAELHAAHCQRNLVGAA